MTHIPPTEQVRNIRYVKKMKGATSRFKGVSWDSTSNMWEVRIVIDRKGKFVGRYKNEIVAAEAYDKAAREYFKELASVNFPRRGEHYAL